MPARTDAPGVAAACGRPAECPREADAPCAAGGRGTPTGACEDRGPARAATCVGRGTPAGGRCPARGGDLRGPRNSCEDRCPACAAGGCGTPAWPPNVRGGPMPCVCGVRREAAERLRGPARTEIPRVRRPAWAAERLREADVPRVAAACGRPAGAARTDAPRVRRPAERPREAHAPRVAAACGRPAERPLVRRPAWVAERPRGPMPPAHNAGGGRIQRPPQTVEQSFARGLPGRGSAGPSARRGRPPAYPAACAVYQAS